MKKPKCLAMIPVPDQSHHPNPDRQQCSYGAADGDFCGVHRDKPGVVSLKDVLASGLKESGGKFYFFAESK